MRFLDIFAASILASVTTAHGGIPGAPKIVGFRGADIAALKARNIFGARAARVDHSHDGSKLHARQGGDVNGRCGKDFGCATCAEGYCCSSGGWCGKGPEYCQAPDSQFEYGPAADANTVPPGGSTRNTLRPKPGSVLYGGEGIYVCTKPGQIAITYDDGPYSYTANVLDLFKSYNFQATFFMTGINLSKGRIDDPAKPWSAVIQRMLSEGHQLASHTWSHQDLSTLTKEQRYDQMIRLEMAMTNIVGKFPTYMRPPYSSCSDASGCPQDMADLGYHISYFDLDTDDYNNITPELQQNAKDNFYKAVNPSDAKNNDFLAIAHDIHYQTSYNLTGYMLDLMVKKGYKGVTMGECLGDPAANWYRTPAARVASTSSFSKPACAPTASSSSSASASFSASASSTSSGAFATPTVTSPDASCGAASGYTCLGFADGECCSQYNYCGASANHCGDGCQAGFGKCGLSLSSSSSAASSVASSLASSTVASSSSATPSPTPSRTPSVDGTCGGANGYTCVGSEYGNCCSQYGWCGAGLPHCGTGCNPLFGICPGSSSSSSVATSSSVRSSSSIVSSVSSSAARSSSSVAASSSSSARQSSSSTRPASSSSSAPSSTRQSSSSVASTSSRQSSSSAASSTRQSSSSVASSTRQSSSSVASSTRQSSSSSRPASTSSSRPASSSSSRPSSSSSSRPASSSSVRPSSSSVQPSSSSRPASSSAPASSSSLRPSSTQASSASPTPTGKKSPNGSCGGRNGYTCVGYWAGECCSSLFGACGVGPAFCGPWWCNPAFGKCN